MKQQLIRHCILSAILLITINVTAQAPQSIPYQAVARDNSGNLLANQSIALRFSIHNSNATGAIVYQETQNITTNPLGLFSVNVGQGTVVNGTFSSIDWGSAPKFLQVEMDAAGGSSYVDMGTQQMMSVPYALYAEKTNNPGTTATYRWATFGTFDNLTGWAFNATNASGDASLLGGITPSAWTDIAAIASQMSSDKEVLRTLFTNKGYAKDNAMIMNENYIQYSSTNGKVVVALFRIKNTTGSAINWAPSFYYSAFSGWDERASVAVNGNNTWTATASGNTTLSMSIPPNRVSTVIFASTSGNPVSVSGLSVRNCRLAFYNNALQLPPGLSFVDDLDTATGGWEQ